MKDLLSLLNGVRVVTLFAAGLLIQNAAVKGATLEGTFWKVLLWIVLVDGVLIVLLTFPPVYRRINYRLVPTRQAQNQALGARCIGLAGEMVEFLSNSQREEPFNPPTHLPPGASQEERHRDWVRSGQLRQQHETNVLAEFKRRFSVRLAGMLGELVRAGRLEKNEPQKITWSLQTIHWVEQVPQALAEKGYELTEGQEPE